MQFGSTPLTGASIAHSFSVDAFLDSIFMSGFIKCLSYDDYFIRPECHDEEDDSPCQGQNFPEHQDGNIAPDPPAKRKLTFGGCDYDPVGGSHTNPTSPSRHVHQPETSDEI